MHFICWNQFWNITQYSVNDILGDMLEDNNTQYFDSYVMIYLNNIEKNVVFKLYLKLCIII